MQIDIPPYHTITAKKESYPHITDEFVYGYALYFQGGIYESCGHNAPSIREFISVLWTRSELKDFNQSLTVHEFQRKIENEMVDGQVKTLRKKLKRKYFTAEDKERIRYNANTLNDKVVRFIRVKLV